MANKAELLEFLDSKVFNPILRATTEGYGEADRRKLQDVQDRTRSEQDRFHHYGNAQWRAERQFGEAWAMMAEG